MKLLTVKEAAAAAQVSTRSIWNWVKAGKLQYRRTAGGSVRIVEASLWRDDDPQVAEMQRLAANY